MTQKLEEQVAHLTRIVDDLSDVIATQDAELRRLSALVDRLVARETARDQEGSGGVILGDERPPHY